MSVLRFFLGMHRISGNIRKRYPTKSVSGASLLFSSWNIDLSLEGNADYNPEEQHKSEDDKNCRVEMLDRFLTEVWHLLRNIRNSA
jgi:hypothetical protein